MAFSLPGMMRAERMTVSCSSSVSRRWLSTAIRDIADIGSAWLPLTSTTSFRGSNDFRSCGRTTIPSGMRRRSSPCAISTLPTMLRPMKATLRPTSPAMSTLLDAVDGGGKARDHHLPRRRPAELFDPRPNGALRRRVARALDVGAVAEKRQHALLPVAGKRVQVERLQVRRRGVHLEVAGVDHHSERRAHRQRHAINRAVGDIDELDPERADLDLVAGRHLVQHGIFEQPMLLQPLAH